MQTTRMGAACWLLATPLFLLASLITGSAWSDPPYSWTRNNISDLGNVTCGDWDTTRPRQVCPPWHTLMNCAFVTTSVLLVGGIVLAWSVLGRGTLAKLMVVAGGVGFIMVGLFPADVDENAHFFAGVMIFVLANTGLLLAGLRRSSGILAHVRPFSGALGLIGLVATALFFVQVDLGVGLGGMERVAVYPMLVWTFSLAVPLVDHPHAATNNGTSDDESP